MSLYNTYLPAADYNNLPHISENFSIPDEHLEDLQDLQDLRELLAQHGMPANIGVRLIHKHFDAREGEIMVFKTIKLPSYGKVETMRPTACLGETRFSPVHYLVDTKGNLQAYEYSDAKSQAPDSEEFRDFLKEFRNLIVSRGLQQRFGLKIDCADDSSALSEQSQTAHRLEAHSDNSVNTSITEFEFPEMRGTILIRDGLPTPGGDHDVTVTTEWYGVPFRQGPGCRHSKSVKKCTHCVHCRNHQDDSVGTSHYGVDGVLSFGGHTIEEGTSFHNMMTQMVEAW